MSTIQYYNEISLMLYRGSRGLPVDIIKYCKGFNLAKSGYDSPAMLVIQFVEAYTVMADDINDADYITLTINGALEFEGLVLSVHVRSGISEDGTIGHSSTIKVVDLTYMLHQFGKVVMDQSLVNDTKDGGIFTEFTAAQVAVMHTRVDSSLQISQYCKNVLTEIFSAYERIIQKLGLSPFLTLANGQPLLNKLQRSMLNSDETLRLPVVLAIQRLHDISSVIEVWREALPETFYDLIMDTFPLGYHITNSNGGVTSVGGYGIAVRESGWLTFDRLRSKTIPDTVIMSSDMSRGAQDRKALFIVVPMWDNFSEAQMKASATYALDGDVLKTWGFSEHTTRLNFMRSSAQDSSAGTDPTILAQVQLMAEQVKTAYQDVHKYYTGVLSCRYIQVKTTDKIRFTQSVSITKTAKMQALVQGYTHTYQAGAVPRLTTDIEFIHGVPEWTFQ